MRQTLMITRVLICLMSISTFALAGEQGSKDSTAADPFGWKSELVTGLNFNQSQFSNWSKGGENSVAWQLLVNGSFDYLQPTYTLDTEFKINYGRNTVGNQGERKTNDEVRLDLVYNRKIDYLVDPYAAVRFISQLDDGFKYGDTTKTKISGRFDPAYVSVSLGAGYKYKELLVVNIGPSAKGTYSSGFASVYTDDPETAALEKQKWEGGVEFVAKLNWKIYENMLFNSNLVTFTDFKKTETDVNWDNTLVTKVNAWLNFNIQFQMIYDQDVSSDLQFRQALAVGLSYTIF